MGMFFKSILFNIASMIFTAFCCAVLTFAFVLPRRAAFRFVQVLYFMGNSWVERIFLGLDYRVTGRENLPEGSYILAVKHYSTYETLKMPVIFGDIAIILKKELTWIPFWGWYTIKTGMIPVDRGGRNKAVESLIAGGRRVIAQGRPILIFPQGTRVAVTDTVADKPYKIGGAKIAEALNLPVVPVATNSGAFWPKQSFFKKSGVVDFKILPAIPAGLSAPELLKQLESVLEPESDALMKNPAYNVKTGRSTLWGFKPLLKIAVFVFALWAGWWHLAASMVERQMGALPQNISSPNKAVVDGFPGALKVTWADVTYASPSGTVKLPLAIAKVWPLPAMPAYVAAPQGFTLDANRKGQPVHFVAESFALDANLPALWKPRAQWAMQFKAVAIKAGESALQAEGHVDAPLFGAPVNGALNARVSGYGALLQLLAQNNILPADNARMAKSFMDAMAVAQGNAGSIAVPVSIKDDDVYISMLKVMSLADLRPPVDESGLIQQRIRSGGSATDGLPAPAPQTPVPAQQP